MTNGHAADEEPTRKLLSGRGMKTRIAAAGVAILAVGAWLTPRAAQPIEPFHPGTIVMSQIPRRHLTTGPLIRC